MSPVRTKRDIIGISNALLDNVPVTARSNPRFLNPKVRLAGTIIRPDALQHVLNKINTPGTQFFTATQRWLDGYEAQYGGQDFPQDIKVVRGDGWTAIYDLLKIRGVNSTYDRLVDVAWITSTGTLVYNELQDACDPPCDGVVTMKQPHLRLLDADHYVCVSVDNPVIALKLVGTAQWGTYLDAYNALPKIDPSIQTRLLTEVNEIRYGQPQQLWIREVSNKALARLEQIVSELLHNPSYFTRFLSHGPDEQWPIQGTVRDLLKRCLIDGIQPTLNVEGAIDRNALLNVPLTYNPDQNGWSPYHNTLRLDAANTKQGGSYANVASALVKTIIEPIKIGLELKMTAMNMISRPMAAVLDDPEIVMLDEPVESLLERVAAGPDLIAAALLKATAMVYGFERWNNGGKSGWTKRDKTGKTTTKATIYDNGQILINDSPKCIIFAQGREVNGSMTSVGLPYGDEIANRMWFLGTSARTKLGVFNTSELADLAILFAKREITDRTIDDLAAEIHTGMLKQQQKVLGG